MSTNTKRFEFPIFKPNDAPMIVRYQEDIKYTKPEHEETLAKQSTVEEHVQVHPEDSFHEEALTEEARVESFLVTDEPLVITELELAEKVNEAKALGFASGYQQREEELDQHQHELEQQLLACYQNIGSSIAEVGQQLEQGWRDISSATIDFAQNLVAKLVDNLPELELTKIIDNTLQEVLPKLATYPELRLQVAPALVPFLEQQCSDWCRQNHFPGQIKVLADNELTGAAYQISWEDGFLVMDSKQLWQQADQLIKLHFSSCEEHMIDDKTLMPEVLLGE